MRMFGVLDRCRGQCPTGVAVDASGLVYVYNTYYFHNICVFTSEGEFVTAFGGDDRCDEEISGLAVDSSGVVYVSGTVSGCIHVF